MVGARPEVEQLRYPVVALALEHGAASSRRPRRARRHTHRSRGRRKGRIARGRSRNWVADTPALIRAHASASGSSIRTSRPRRGVTRLPPSRRARRPPRRRSTGRARPLPAPSRATCRRGRSARRRARPPRRRCRTGVGDLDHRVPVVRGHGDGDRGPGGRVTARSRAGCRRPGAGGGRRRPPPRLGRERDLALRLDRPRRLDGFAHEVVELDGLALQRPALVEPGQEKQVVDEEAHALGLAADPRHRAGEVLGPLRGAALEELRVRAHRGERRAELV